MELYGFPLSAWKLVEKLNEGGWVVSGGRRVRGISAPNFPVIKAHLLGNEATKTVMIETNEGTVELPGDRIAMVNPYTAVIRHTFMRKEQRSKIEGGGWREVPAVGVALEIQHVATAEEQRKIRAEEQRRQDEINAEAERRQREESEREEEKRRQREAEALVTRRQEFVNNLNAKFAGKRPLKIEVFEGTKLRILFEGDSTIEIGSDISDCCGYNWGSAVVNGVSLRDFRECE